MIQTKMAVIDARSFIVGWLLGRGMRRVDVDEVRTIARALESSMRRLLRIGREFHVVVGYSGAMGRNPQGDLLPWEDMDQIRALTRRAVTLYDGAAEVAESLDGVMDVSGVYAVLEELFAENLRFNVDSERLYRHMEAMAQRVAMTTEEQREVIGRLEVSEVLDWAVEGAGDYRGIVSRFISVGNPFRRVVVRLRERSPRESIREAWPSLRGWGKGLGGLVIVAKDIIDVALGVGEDWPTVFGPRTFSAVVDGVGSVAGGLALTAGSLAHLRKPEAE